MQYVLHDQEWLSTDMVLVTMQAMSKHMQRFPLWSVAQRIHASLQYDMKLLDPPLLLTHFLWRLPSIVLMSDGQFTVCCDAPPRSPHRTVTCAPTSAINNFASCIAFGQWCTAFSGNLGLPPGADIVCIPLMMLCTHDYSVMTYL